ncbi:MAG: glycine--tRNA ligase [Phycisphaerales bacterium]|nr:MAG: glycine--tRNA ligase [Phycisphaerales bacterium]
MAATADVMDKIVALCKRRGFIFQSSEVYGGIGGFWDYGPLGVELKRNVKDAWWADMVRNAPLGPDNIEFQMVGVDCSIIMNPKVWEASGHVGGFSDPMQTCRQCKRHLRADQIADAVQKSEWHEELKRIWHEATPPNLDKLKSWARKRGSKLAPGLALVREPGVVIDALARALARAADPRQSAFDAVSNVLFSVTGRQSASDICPHCGGELTEPREFNLMFETFVGAMQDSSSKAYLRPETAQGIFANFKNVLDSTRVKLPLGIAQIGKAFRNEINPRNYTFRSREFEQYEIEFFCHPSEADMWYEFWRDVRHRWYVELGLRSDKLRLREHEPDELAHYARTCADVEYDFPFGLSELEGIANRTDFDLKAHISRSGKDLSYFDDQRKERFVPYVIEPSGGVDRSVLAFITEAYTVDENRASPELMKFHPRLAPTKAAVFPLVAKDGLPEIAEPIYRDIKKSYPCQYDAKQSIGRRYARMDEAGTPFCFTIDGQTKEDGTVTVRDRDDASQIRIDKSRCLEYLRDRLPI